jgi:hypothetical protein
VTGAALTLVGRRLLRPPVAELSLVVSLRNDARGPRWLLLSRDAAPDARPVGSEGVHSVELVHMAGATIGRFAGTAPFDAVHLAAGAALTLPDWSVEVWDDPPLEEVELEVLSAAAVRIGGMPIEAWLERGTWNTPDLSALPVELEDERRERIRLHI